MQLVAQYPHNTQIPQIARCATPSALDAAVRRVLNASLRRNAEHVGLSILSAEDEAAYSVLPEEREQLSPRLCQKKQTEQAIGRVAARKALAQIGIDRGSAILRGDCGEPLWPSGVVGSITHCWPWSIAVVAHRAQCSAIGIDLESIARAQQADIARVICCPAELDWVHSTHNFLQATVMLFSAKEAAYKAFYPLCKRYIDFQEVELTWAPMRECFHGRFAGPIQADLLQIESFEVYCRRIGDLIFSCTTPALN